MKASRDSWLVIRPSFLFFLTAYYYFDPISSFWPFFTAVLAHEGAHLLALVHFGLPVYRLELGLGGAVMEMGPTAPGQELLIAVAGPAMNYLLLKTLSPYLPVVGLVNLCLLLYNLLPFYPLDGGRILRALLVLSLPEKIAGLLEKTAAALCFLLILLLSLRLTFGRQAGWWPIFLSLSLALRLGQLLLREKAPEPLCP